MDTATTTDSGSLAADIARRLNETNPIALGQIEQIVVRLGAEPALDFLRQTLEIEAGGGMPTANQKRRRTPGGVYLHLIKSHISPEERRIIWPPQNQSGTGTKRAGDVPPRPPFTWEERLNLAPELLKYKGEAFTVKITLIGRPGRIIEKGEVILTSMQNSKVPALPKGLPTPPAEATTYVVYIARKQWSKVKEAIEDPQDALIVEGYPVFDARLKAMAVFATNTTTKLLQRAQRESQRARPSAGE